MGVRRTDPIEDRKRALMRQAASEQTPYTIGGKKKQGSRVPRKPSMPKLPWRDKTEDDKCER